jgi:hypothetical protein
VASLNPSQYSEQIVEVKSTKDVSNFYAQFKNKNFQSHETEASVLKAITTPLIPLKGIYWRLNNVLTKIKIIDNTVDSALNRFYSHFDIRAPHIPHFANFFVWPDKEKKSFSKISDIQHFALQTLAPLIDKSINTLDQVIKDKLKNESDQVLFQLDLSSLYGEKRVSNLINKKTRFLDIYTSDIILLKAFLQDIQGSLLYVSSYNLDNIHKMINVFRGYVILSKAKQFFSRIKGKKRAMTHYQSLSEGKLKMLKKLKSKSKYKHLFTLKNLSYQGKNTLTKAKEYFLKAVQSKMASIKLANKNLVSSQTKRSKRLQIESLSNIFKLSLKHLKLKENLLKGPMTVHDQLFSENVKVNVNALFDPNNHYIKDLKRLFPNPSDFKVGTYNFQKNKPIKIKSGLPSLTLGGLLPEIKDFGELKKKKFLLIQRAGVGFPLALFLTTII